MSGYFRKKKIALAGARMFVGTSVSAQTVKGVVTEQKSVNVYVFFYPQYTYILIFFIYFCNKKTKT